MVQKMRGGKVKRSGCSRTLRKDVLPEIEVKNHEAKAVIPRSKFDTLSRWWVSITVDWPKEPTPNYQIYFTLGILGEPPKK
jgi:hypothetical protein